MDTDIDLTPVVLEGRHVRLEPLDLERHWDGLVAIGLEPSLWKFTVAKIDGPEALRRYFETALADQARGVTRPFVTLDRASGRVAGSTRFGNIVPEYRRAEIGWTWLGPEFQRSSLNTEAKLLMLTHAFETWKLFRVELKTSLGNEKSKNAMRRLRFVEEGTFRKWMLHGDGSRRDTVWFSVIDDEWPETKAHIEALLARY